MMTAPALRPRGASGRSPAASPRTLSSPLPGGRSHAYGGSPRPLDPAALDRFMAIYTRHLDAIVRRPSLGYAYGPESVPQVVERMRRAFASGRYGLDGHALRGTCRTLGIRTTRRAIEAFLRGELSGRSA